MIYELLIRTSQLFSPVLSTTLSNVGNRPPHAFSATLQKPYSINVITSGELWQRHVRMAFRWHRALANDASGCAISIFTCGKGCFMRTEHNGSMREIQGTCLGKLGCKPLRSCMYTFVEKTIVDLCCCVRKSLPTPAFEVHDLCHGWASLRHVMPVVSFMENAQTIVSMAYLFWRSKFTENHLIVLSSQLLEASWKRKSQYCKACVGHTSGLMVAEEVGCNYYEGTRQGS